MKHVFIVTYGRSGSTVLLKLLNQIDGYCIRGENMGLLNDLALATAKAAQAVQEYGRHGASIDNPWYGIDRVEPDQLGKSLAQSFTDKVLQPPPGTRVCGFKEIRYVPKILTEAQFATVIEFLLNYFPDARIIFNMRDHAQVAQSGWWAKRPPSEVQRIVGQCDDMFRTAHAAHPAQTLIINYDEYRSDIAGLRRILDWLDERLPDETLTALLETRLMHMQKTNDRENDQPKSMSLGKVIRHFRR